MNTTPEELVASMHYAARSGNEDDFFKWVDKGADVLAKDKLGNIALHHAAYGGNVNIVDYLASTTFAMVGPGAINSRNNDNITPLFYGCTCGHATAIRVLLSYGAQPDIRTSNGKTPKDWCHPNDALSLAALTENLKEVDDIFIERKRKKAELLEQGKAKENEKTIDAAIQEMLRREQDALVEMQKVSGGVGLSGSSADECADTRATMMAKLHDAKISIDQVKVENDMLEREIQNLKEVVIPAAKGKAEERSNQIKKEIAAIYEQKKQVGTSQDLRIAEQQMRFLTHQLKDLSEKRQELNLKHLDATNKIKNIDFAIQEAKDDLFIKESSLLSQQQH